MTKFVGNLKNYSITSVILIILCWSLLIQLVFVSSFDKVKQAVSRWPYFSTPHLQLAVEFYKNSSLDTNREFLLGKKLLFRNPDIINYAENEIVSPEEIEKKIIFWKALLNNGVDLPFAYLNIALLKLSVYDIKSANEWWQKAFYLNPNSEIVVEVREIINKKEN